MIRGEGTPAVPLNYIHNHHDVLAHLFRQYDEDVASGIFRPYVLPYGWLGALVVFIYLLLPHRNRPYMRYLGYLVFAFNLVFSVHLVLHTRTKAVVCEFALGVLSAWSAIWSAALLVFNDVQVDFKRIVRVKDGDRCLNEHEGEGNGYAVTSKKIGYSNKSGADSVSLATANGDMKGTTDSHGTEYRWETYPSSSFGKRLDWVADICTNFRGAGWNWQPHVFQKPPNKVLMHLKKSTRPEGDPMVNRQADAPFKTYDDKSSLLRKKALTFVIGYLVLDCLKTFLMKDPYFYGFIDEPAPAHIPAFFRQPVLPLRAYRSFVSLLAAYTFIQTIFALGPLFFVGLLGQWITTDVRTEPWMYPSVYGRISAIFTNGLAGWWSHWWHQIFRYAFSAPSRALISTFNLNRQGIPAKIIQLTLAFTLSGLLHACGSHTVLGPTNPMSASFLFFILQAVGIIVQIGSATALQRVCGLNHNVLPRWCFLAANFLFAHLWLLFTAHLVLDDFARGGIWLFEPVPVSIVRALGFGVEGDSWWCWVRRWMRWHSDERWWLSGVTF